MKVNFVIPASLLVSLALMGVMKMRRKDHEKDDKRIRFQDIKLKVTNDVLLDYENEKGQNQKVLEKMQSEHKSLDNQMIVLQTKLDTNKGKADECIGDQKSTQDELALVETNLNNAKGENEKEITHLKSEVDVLKKQLTEQSEVCNFLKEVPETARTFCPNIKQGESDAQKAAPPKQEGAKEEIPKQQEPPKQGEPPKQEPPKEGEPPKQEPPKQGEPPKQEEAPKQGEPPK